MQETKPRKSPLLWVPSGYFTMALTYMTLTSVTAIMFKNMGMSNGQAAEYASYLILAYTIKPLFAPFVEMYKTKKFFVICTQLTIALGFAGVVLTTVAATGARNWLVVLLRHGPLPLYGRISYGLYVYHLFSELWLPHVFGWLHVAAPLRDNLLFRLAWQIVLTVG